MKKTTNEVAPMMEATKEQEQNTRAMMDELESNTSLLNLGYLPSLISTYIDCYHLDSTEMTPEQIYDFGNSHNTLYKLLSLIQNELYEANEVLSKYI